MPPIIEIRDLSKQYLLGETAAMYGSLREALTRGLRGAWAKVRPASPNGNGPGNRGSFWALRNVNLDVAKGDTIGIIGSNGAGKSTLLKILSRITDPTEGYAKLRGQAASLLEVGTGFHPELTGRENIYMNGAIMGMRKAEIDAAFDEIIGFAGIGKFIDTPVKRYSSGMYVRLAFSIAANLDPEILIVDEVLAVGDIAFQKKCLGKMAEACSRAKTVLFVSHNLAAVEALCNRGVVLQQGGIVFNGTAKEAVQYYLHNLSGEAAQADSHIIDLASAPGRPAKFRPLLKRLELYTGDGEPLSGDLPIGAPLKAKVAFDLEEPSASFDVGIGFNTLAGHTACVVGTVFEPNRNYEERTGEQVLLCDIPSLPLIPGEYKITVYLEVTRFPVDRVDDAARFTIRKSDYYGTGVVPCLGTFVVENSWSVERTKNEPSLSSSGH